jgi:formimidoylglutamate deiminase
MTLLWAETALTAAGWQEAVRVEIGQDGRIAAVTAGAPPEGERLAILLPAPTNLHSHAFQRAMAGLTERRGPDPRDSFWTWRALMYRFLDRLTPDDVEAIAAFVQLEMLEAGYAAVAEFHYLHHAPGGTPYADPAEMSARIAAAAAATGIGLTLVPVLYQWGGCDRRPLAAGQDRFGSTPGAFAALHARAAAALAPLPADTVLGIAPHSLRAVDPDGLAAILPLAPGGPVHIHAAEQVAEVEEVVSHRGARPVEWLLANAPVDDGWCLIHATQMLPAETADLAASGATAGLCPITESSLGDGIFDGAAYLRAGGSFGIGSDSNIRISLSEELRTLEYSQRLRDRARSVLARPEASTGRVLLEGAVAGGARAAGRSAGAISPGLWADLVALDGAAITLAGVQGDTILDSFVFAGDDRLVSDVWSAGRRVVAAGRHPARAAITDRYRATLTRLRTDL